MLKYQKRSCSDFGKITLEWFKVFPLYAVTISVLLLIAVAIWGKRLSWSFQFLLLLHYSGLISPFFWVFVPNWLKRRGKGNKYYFSLITFSYFERVLSPKFFVFFFFPKSKVYSNTNILFSCKLFIVFVLSSCYPSFSPDLCIFQYFLCLPLCISMLYTLAKIIFLLHDIYFLLRDTYWHELPLYLRNPFNFGKNSSYNRYLWVVSECLNGCVVINWEKVFQKRKIVLCLAGILHGLQITMCCPNEWSVQLCVQAKCTYRLKRASKESG